MRNSVFVAVIYTCTCISFFIIPCTHAINTDVTSSDVGKATVQQTPSNAFDPHIRPAFPDDNDGNEDGNVGDGKEATDDENCQDGDTRCVFWARHGECDFNQDYMHAHCKKSCKKCGLILGNSNSLDHDYGMNRNSSHVHNNRDRTGRNQHRHTTSSSNSGASEAEAMKVEDGRFGLGLTRRYGEPQHASVRASEKRVAHVIKARVQKMITYMEEEVSKPEYNNIRHRCRNLESLCVFWAVRGECEKNPSYMTRNCSPVCEKCGAPLINIFYAEQNQLFSAQR